MIQNLEACVQENAKIFVTKYSDMYMSLFTPEILVERQRRFRCVITCLANYDY